LKVLMCKNEQEQEPCCEKESYRAEAGLMKTKNSGAGARAMFMKKTVSFLRRLRRPGNYKWN